MKIDLSSSLMNEIAIQQSKSLDTRRHLFLIMLAMIGLLSCFQNALHAEDGKKDTSLIGYWKLQEDTLDYSGHNHHGTNHGVKFEQGQASRDLEANSKQSNDKKFSEQKSGVFNGIDAYIEISNNDSLKFGSSDFTISAWIYTEKDLDDVIGDVLSKYDPKSRRGINLAINSGAGGYQGQGNDRHVYFGIDNAKMGEWQDCGRPSPTSNYVSNSLTVYKGKLYAANTDAKDEKDWAHVFCYDRDQKWIDCGRVGDRRTAGVGPLIVHNDELYAVTATYDWTRVNSSKLKYAPGRVYRYAGDKNWIECGEPSDNRTLTSAISFKGKLYVGGGPNTWGVFVQDEKGGWQPSKLFSRRGPQKCFPHGMGRYNGRFYVGFQSVHAFDGKEWSFAGLPVEPESTLQTHAFAVYQGNLLAGTWPVGKVGKYLGGEKWEDIGRVGEDATEVMDLLVYNGKLYGCSIPRAEVCRYDDDPKWTSLKRFYSPDGWTPVPPQENAGSPTNDELNSWTRVTSMTIYNGKLFCGIGSCTSSILDAPVGVRGTVFSIEVGKCTSHDDDLGPGWKHIVAMRDRNRMKIFVQGKLVAQSSEFKPQDYDISNEQPLRIGFGQIDYFNGRITDLRIYSRALSEQEIAGLAK